MDLAVMNERLDVNAALLRQRSTQRREAQVPQCQLPECDECSYTVASAGETPALPETRSSSHKGKS